MNGESNMKKRFLVVAIIVEGIIIAVLSVILVITINNIQVSVVDGTSGAYVYNNAGDNIRTMNVICDVGDRKYDFYITGYYNIIKVDGSEDNIIETGEYYFDKTTIHLVPQDEVNNRESAEHTVKYISGELVVDSNKYKCVEYEDGE